MAFLGIDTSNYTTSAAIFDGKDVVQSKKLLPVKEGELGIRQSDAVFHHVRQLPQIVEALGRTDKAEIEAVGVSVRPRPIEGSYMPCFEAGHSTARVLASVLGVPLYCFSHQEGHIAAAAYSAGFSPNVGDRFCAFHVSGGTTEAVMVKCGEYGYETEYLCGSLDLKAGQAVDRTANMLSLPFPGGAHLEKLALCWNEPIKGLKVAKKGMDICLSGVENICRKMKSDGQPDEKIARTCIEYIRRALMHMADSILEKYGDIPLLFAGGVMSNSIIREDFTKRYGAYFAKPEFSCDNAAGIAILASRAFEDRSGR
ncbi:MAG: peptidase M22 [Ruminococcaceae bacterium]|nr:peptidase M22 [Oscillospiraceae bacterium]